MRLKLISCEVFYREMCWAVSQSPHMIDVQFLPKGLHDLGAAPMRDRLQAALDRFETERDPGIVYDAVLLGYGLCNNGLVGLTARSLPLVLTRAHDCITLFLGGGDRYQKYFDANPGIYFKTSGWVERGEANGELSQLSIQQKSGMDSSYEELVAKYGEDNARFLFDTLCNYTHNYSQFTFIEMGVEPDDRFEVQSREEAARRGWKFEKVRGDMGLITRLLNGEWNEREFLVIPPGHRIVAHYGEGLVAADPAGEAAQ